MKKFLSRAALVYLALTLGFDVRAKSSPVPEPVLTGIDREYPTLFELYKHLHAHPELSFQEEKTSALVAEELKNAGYEVASKVGKHGVVAILRNGVGPTVLVRTDLDGLP